VKNLILIVVCSVSLLFSNVNAAPVSIQHKLGTTTVNAVPKRVVAIGIGAVDTLDYFGITPIAVSKGIAYPAYLERYNSSAIPSSGSLFEPDFEAIYNLKPDLIIVGIRAAKAYGELEQIAPTLLFAPSDQQSYWTSTKTQWGNIGKIFNIEDRVEKTIAGIEQKIEAIRQYNQAHKVDALTILSSGGNITAFGSESRFAAIYKDFGFTETVQNIKQSRHGDLVSYEFIRDAKPSNLLIIDRDKVVKKGQSNLREQFDNELIKATPAYQNGRMIFLDANAWYLALAGVNATKQMIQDLAY